MVLGRGGCNRIVYSNREDTPASENRDFNSGSEGEDGTETTKIQTRGLSSLPPPIPSKSDRPLIRPDGKTQWIELPKVGKDRKPASVLTRLLRDHHPGLVDYKGKEVVAMKWEHYQEKKDSSGRSKADEVKAEFWERYKRKYIEKTGERSDWLRSPVDSGALYDCNSGKPHGKWGLFNGAVDDKEVLTEAKSSRPSSVFKQQRREVAENERRRQAEKCRVQNIYTQNVIVEYKGAEKICMSAEAC